MTENEKKVALYVLTKLYHENTLFSWFASTIPMYICPNKPSLQFVLNILNMSGIIEHEENIMDTLYHITEKGRKLLRYGIDQGYSIKRKVK